MDACGGVVCVLLFVDPETTNTHMQPQIQCAMAAQIAPWNSNEGRRLFVATKKITERSWTRADVGFDAEDDRHGHTHTQKKSAMMDGYTIAEI
mmetsp:Transcript_6809/g.16371  ORF Transcript_6809/g.16371 Transcript_6809/m.16371 type:complete len:93 (+) Transcript_6809:529-807(+)